MVNADLFRKIADQVEEWPESYSQCGTTNCIGGWACKFAGVGWINVGKALGISMKDEYTIFAARWKPRKGLTVPQALRLIADGKSVSEVSA